MDKRVVKLDFILWSIFIGAILLLSVPTLLVIFFNISKTLFVTLNTIGLLLATLRIVLSLAINVSVVAAKAEGTAYKSQMDQQAKILFIMTVVLQFINFMFVQFE